ncbi:HD domain-containing protein [Nocardia wallacei]|uniref:HD domain-containing protein n=1 Tax=Nocardia wallacei TaxID=480035 RepID=UPI0024552E6E|nr:HD domain-containing protein [Nocardia wallacei]
MTSKSRGIVEFAYETGFLKRLPRSGWLTAGVAAPESVAEHSFRTAVLAYLIASGEGADPEHAAVLGLFHDLPETRIGDVPAAGRAYVKTVAPTEVVADQTAGLPSALAEGIRAAIAEHESAKLPGASLESRCSRDADKLELLMQAREYQEAQGNATMQSFVDSMLPLFSTDTAKQLAQAAMDTPPAAWWNEFAAKFGTSAAANRPVRLAK